MQTAQPSLFTREDTLFGVCEALGEDFRMSPTFFRIAFALPLFWNPVAVLVAYLAAGALVALSRWAFPNTRPEAASKLETTSNDERESIVAQNDAKHAHYALAA